MELHKKIIEVVENNGFSMGGVNKQNNGYYVEINQFTPAGEDWWEVIWFDGTNEGFAYGVKERYLDFDVDEEVEVWVENRGKGGVPSSIKTLVMDAEWKEKKLEKLADTLYELNIEELEELEEA